MERKSGSVNLLIALYILAGLVWPLHCSDVPFQSKKSPSEIINSYEVISPEVNWSSEKSRQGHAKTINVVLPSKNGTYEIILHLNELLLSPNFTSAYHVNGEKFVEHHDNCFYHGYVIGHKDWKAVFSTCYGLRGSFGSLHDADNLYHLEPKDDTISLTDEHVLYKDNEHQNNKHSTCGTGKKHDIAATGGVNELNLPNNHHKLRKRQASDSRIVEWLVVNDYQQYLNYNQNLSAVGLRAIEIANHIDMLYNQAFNIRIVLVHSLTWTDEQRIMDTEDSDTLLDEFEDYHRDELSFRDIVHDSAMMITGIDITGTTVGVAYRGVMCNYDLSVGVTQDTRSTVNSVGSIAAHELGHIFNMQHDDAPGCECPSDDGCVMNAALGFPPPTEFSECSRLQLQEGQDAGQGICLDNSPTMLFGEPACGNGIKEPGEVCDCGSVEECNDPCCNATTCIPVKGSDCAGGECCTSNCKFVQYGTTCRQTRGTCGISEYCSGDSAECPRDVYAQNGIPCENNTAYCYGGECVSHNSQCEIYYGKESKQAVIECYEGFNTKGEIYGHCGATSGAFIPCPLEDVLCGSIQCDGGQLITDNITFTEKLFFSTNQVPVEGRYNDCNTFSLSATSDQISPGLVLEGTKCGDEKLCISQECVSLSTLVGVSPCPIGSNTQTCSGNGICNNLNKCSCNVGYNGSDCSEPVRTSSSSDTSMTITTMTSPSVTVATATTTSTSGTKGTSIQSSTASPPSIITTTHTSPPSLPTTTRTYITPVITSSVNNQDTTSANTNRIVSTSAISYDLMSSLPPLSNNTRTELHSTSHNFVPSSTSLLKTVTGSNQSGIEVFRVLLIFQGNSAAAVAAGITVTIVFLIIIAIIIVVLVVILLYVKRTRSKTLNPPRNNTYSNVKPTSHKAHHGSADDLLMTGVTSSRGSNTPSPVPPSNLGPKVSYKPYVPPQVTPISTTPSTTVNQMPRRPPPPVNNQPHPSPVVQKSRPPPPSRAPPAPSAPTLPVSRPTPAPRTNAPPPMIKTIGDSSPKPPTAPKPSKMAVQWPPPSGDKEKTAPAPLKKPMIPPPR